MKSEKGWIIFYDIFNI